MNQFLSDFLDILQRQDRYEALRYVLDLLNAKKLKVVEVYEELLAPALYSLTSSDDENIDIWKEHVRTSIIKTIIENLLPYVVEERKELNIKKAKTVALFSPPEEYHDVGARMAADVFSIMGFDTIYVGSNTPLRVLEAGLNSNKIDIVALSVSNPYHLVSARNIIASLRKSNPKLKIIIGGSAASKVKEQSAKINADNIVLSLKELIEISGGL